MQQLPRIAQQPSSPPRQAEEVHLEALLKNAEIRPHSCATTVDTAFLRVAGLSCPVLLGSAKGSVDLGLSDPLADRPWGPALPWRLWGLELAQGHSEVGTRAEGTVGQGQAKHTVAV